MVSYLVKLLTSYLIFLFAIAYLLQSHSTAFAIEQSNYAVFSEQTVEFSSIEDINQTISSVKDSDVLIVKFKFNPFDPQILAAYLPDGYITINGTYDVFELMLKTFFRPIVANNEIKTLILDINFFIQNGEQKNILYIKNLVERMSTDFARKKYRTMLGLKFKYNPLTQDSIDALFNYTIISSQIKALQIDSGYLDWISKTIQAHLKQLKYLSLENNIIGAQNVQFQDFLSSLKKFKTLEILNLNHNSIGSHDGQFKLLSEQIQKMSHLKYLSLENNLLGVFPTDSTLFLHFMQKNKSISINIQANYSFIESSNAHH